MTASAEPVRDTRVPQSWRGRCGSAPRAFPPFPPSPPPPASPLLSGPAASEGGLPSASMMGAGGVLCFNYKFNDKLLELTSPLLSRSLPREPRVLISIKLARDCAQLWESLVPRTQQSSSQGSDGEKQPLLSPTEELYRNQMLTEQKGRYRPEAVWSESARFMQPLCIYDTRTDSIMLSGTYTGLNLNQFQVEGQNCHNTGMRPLFPCQAL